MDEYRFRTQQAVQNEPHIPSSFASPHRNNNPRLPPQQQYHQQQHLQQSHYQQQQQQQPSELISPHDPRSNLPRRFTTDSGRVPTLSSMNMGLTSPLQRGPDPSQQEYASHKHQLLEKKKQEYERIREQRRKFEIQMQKLEEASRREAQEMLQMEEELYRVTGHQSEPTTPPDHYSAGFPSALSRPSRLSMSQLSTPPGLHNRSFRSGMHLTASQSTIGQSRFGWDDILPSRSVPTTRRNSGDDEKDEAVRQDPTSHRSTHAVHRYSMPVTRNRNGVYETDLDGTNVTGFLFGEENSGTMPNNTADDRFPTLVRRDDQMLSASSAALDLALSSTPVPEAPASNHWSNHINRHRTQQSLSAINGASPSLGGDSIGIHRRSASSRQSLDLRYISEQGGDQPGNVMATPPKLQSSFSSNDVPTVKSTSGSSMGAANANNHAQNHFHQHNASIGRIPAGVAPTRGHSRELSIESSNISREQAMPYHSTQSALHANAAPFGPNPTASASQVSNAMPAPNDVTNMTAYNNYYANHGYNGSNGYPVANGYSSANGNTNGYASNNAYQIANGGNSSTNGYTPSGFPPVENPNGAPNYGMNVLSTNMQQMNVNAGNGNAMYPQRNYAGYGSGSYGQGQQPRDSQTRVMQHRRQVDSESMSRFHNMPLENFHGQIHDLCKDQHGCRYLQKKLEERNPEQVHAIWLETHNHVVDLMTDPFGNYLCQKLLEYCNDDERTALITNAAKDMVRIALNQHGTRALQKMIEYVNTPQQIHLIIDALRNRVVDLIQDLNGNHVIQKCLNKLSSHDAQFIFDAVGNHCVEVGTHRHGCCVLQRCIDHASGDQKLWLIQRITEHSRVLVQDPFGNYVVQYIIDLDEPTFTEPIVGTFRGCIGQLSRHKFSSNVIEKCLRCALPPSKDMIVEEMLQSQEMDRLLRDNFANYVVQTALDYATPSQKIRLVEAIRPMLPQIRATPYGRRIQAKVSAYDTRGEAATSGQVTPADNTQGQISLRDSGSHSRALSLSGDSVVRNSLLDAGGQPVQLNTNVQQNAPSSYTNGSPVGTNSHH